MPGAERTIVKGRLGTHLVSRELTALRAARLIASVTLALVVVSGVLMHWADRKTFPNVWLGLWWAVQTVTSVGYGDVVPQSLAGRLLALVVMLNGIALLTVVVATISSVFVEQARRRAAREDSVVVELRRLNARLDALLAGERRESMGTRGDE